MDLNRRKEEFSRAYVHAIATVAGCTLGKPEVDEDSVDTTIYSSTPGTQYDSPRLDIQLKCTASDSFHEGKLVFELPAKNYRELRGPGYLVPRLLVVVVVPPSLGDWIDHSELQMAMRRCGYWLSLRELPEVDNVASVTLHIPRTQTFNAASLDAIMTRIGDGGNP